MFSKVALLSAFVGLVAGAALDVWDPPVTSPTAASVWPTGSTQNVTWDISTKPSHVTNPIGTIYLSKDGTVDVDHPLATGFLLTQGSQVVTVPSVIPGSYFIYLFGDSSNTSPRFTITD